MGASLGGGGKEGRHAAGPPPPPKKKKKKNQTFSLDLTARIGGHQGN